MGICARRGRVLFAAACLVTTTVFAQNTTPPIDGGNNVAGNLNPVGVEPNAHKSFIRDANHNFAFTDTSYAAGVKQFFDLTNQSAQYGSGDFLFVQCYSGGFLNDIAAQGFLYSFASSSGYAEPSFSADNAGTNRNPNFNGNVDNFTRAWNEGAASPAMNANATASMLNIFNGANLGTAIPGAGGNVNVGRDPFARPSFGGGEERPQYSSSGAGSDARTLADAPNGSRQFAVLVAWDNPDPRHALNINRIYNTLRTVYNVPANQIAVLYPKTSPIVVQTPDGQGGTNYTLPTFAAGGPGAPINDNNTAANFLEAMGSGFFGAANGPTTNDKIFVYNTGHGGHTALMQPGEVGGFQTQEPPPGGGDPPPAPAIDVRYKIPVNSEIIGGQVYGGFGVPGQPTLPNPITQGDDIYKSIGGIPDNLPGGGNDPGGHAGDVGFNRMELILKPNRSIKNPGANDQPVKVRLNGHDLTALPLPASMAPQFNCDDILGGGAFVYYTLDFQSNEYVPDPNLDPDNIVIDLLNIADGQRSPWLLHAVDLIGGDQEALFVVVPEPSAIAAFGFGISALVLRRTRRAI